MGKRLSNFLVEDGYKQGPSLGYEFDERVCALTKNQRDNSCDNFQGTTAQRINPRQLE